MAQQRVHYEIGGIPKDYSDYPEWVRTAEATGFDGVGCGDSSTLWTDPFVTLSIAAQNSKRLGLGVTGTNPLTRHPVVAAAASQSVQMISGGRFHYALGSGDSAVANIGQPRARMADLEAYATAVRGLTAGESVTWRGQALRMNWNTPRVPVLLCAEGPRTQRLAGRMSDGVVLYNGLTPEVLTASINNVREGAREAGRNADELQYRTIVVFQMCDDIAKGREAVKFSLAGTANRAFRNSLFDKMVPEHLHAGFRGLQSEYRSSHHQQLGEHSFNAALLDKYGLADYLIERFAVIGPPRHCAERLKEIASYGLTHISLSILAQTPREQMDSMRIVADEVFPHLR